MYRNEIKELLNNNKDYREALFARGYLITSKKDITESSYPFYNEWNSFSINKFKILTHPLQKIFIREIDGKSILLIGHAFNPFDDEIDENKIISTLLLKYNQNKDSFYSYLEELTGIFIVCLIEDDKIVLVQDCHGLKSAFFGKIENKIYISSHAQLIADLLNLEIDPYIKKLINNRMYTMSNRYLPGNLSTYRELKRLGPNTVLFLEESFFIKRIFPTKSHIEHINEEDIRKTTLDIANIIKKSLNLVTKKWNNPAISLSGGVDSKMTLASASDNYDKFTYFSYISKEQERIDTELAKSICQHLNLSHTVYEIPADNIYYEDYSSYKKIIEHNTSYYKKTADNEIRKLIYLYKKDDFDVEVKSWGGETTRVFMDRKYNLKMPTILNERHLSVFQTRYFLTPRLLNRADNENYNFMREIKLEKPLYNYEHSDLYYWEVRMGAWGASVVNSFDLCHEVVIPLNNRKIINMFMAIPREIRMNDALHKSITKLNNPSVDVEEHVKNLYFHSYRKTLEKVYFRYRTIFYIPRK